MHRRLFLILFVTLPWLLSGCLSSGLDLNRARSAREWIKLCAATRGDVYCAAAQEAIRGIDGPLVFLIPNAGIQQTSQTLQRRYGADPSAARRLARANLFKATEVSTGTMTSLDGQVWQVTCRRPGQGCRISTLQVTRMDNSRSPQTYGGMVYYTTGGPDGNGFLPPK